MKKILIVAPKSFPVIDAEAIVNIKLLTALSNDGNFQIDLISKMGGQNYPTDSFESYNVKINRYHIEKVENKISVLSIWQHIKAFFVFGSTFMGAHWAIKALPTMKKFMESNNYDYLLTKNSPSLLLGYYAKKKYGIKWVATWNDPCPDVKYPEPYGKGSQAKVGLLDWLQIRVMKQADVHIFPSSRIKDYMISYLKISEEKCRVIPHVALNTDKTPFLCSEKSVLKMIHSGNLKYPRNPRPFLKALHTFHKAFPERELSVTLMGVFDKDIPSLVNSLELGSIVHLSKAVSYQESISILADYHVCIIIEADCEEGIFLPTKVSDFFQCGKTVFSLSPQNGVLNDLFKKGCISYFSYVNSEEEIYTQLCKIYQDYKLGAFNNNSFIPAEFSEKVIAQQYASL